MKKRSPEEKAFIKYMHSEARKCVACNCTTTYFSLHRKVRASQGGKYTKENVAVLCREHDYMLHGYPDQFRGMFSEELYMNCCQH